MPKKLVKKSNKKPKKPDFSTVYKKCEFSECESGTRFEVPQKALKFICYALTPKEIISFENEKEFYKSKKLKSIKFCAKYHESWAKYEFDEQRNLLEFRAFGKKGDVKITDIKYFDKDGEKYASGIISDADALKKYKLKSVLEKCADSEHAFSYIYENACEDGYHVSTQIDDLGMSYNKDGILDGVGNEGVSININGGLGSFGYVNDEYSVGNLNVSALDNEYVEVELVNEMDDYVTPPASAKHLGSYLYIDTSYTNSDYSDLWDCPDECIEELNGEKYYGSYKLEFDLEDLKDTKPYEINKRSVYKMKKSAYHKLFRKECSETKQGFLELVVMF